MSDLSLKTAAVLSLILHAFFFITAITVIRKPSRLTLPEPYTVKLVSPSEIRRGGIKKGKSIAAIKEIKKKRQAILKKKKSVVIEEKEPSKKTTLKKKRTSEEISVEDRIAALKAKKRIEKIVKLRREVLVNRSATGKGTEKPGEGGSGTATGGYEALIKERIWGEWVLPEFLNVEGLEALIRIRIHKDGRIEIVKVEESSNNSLFDRSALRAIQKASPLPPPPRQLEVYLRFRP
jgi:colicin import membrane protein